MHSYVVNHCVPTYPSVQWATGCQKPKVFSERELRFTSRSLFAVARPSVCRLSVTFVRPTQAVEIFGNIGSRPSDHYFRSVCWFVSVIVQSFSEPSLIRF